MGGPVVAIVVAAGAGVRLDAGAPKAFAALGDRSILERAAAAAASSPSVTALVVAVPPGWEGRARDRLADLPVPVEVVAGMPSRQGSVRSGLAAVADDVEVIAVHDAARPFASPDLFERVIGAILGGADAAVPVVPATDTVLRTRGGAVVGAERRDELALAQTPQAFRARALREAHAKADAAGRSFTDDASLLVWAGFEVRTLPGDPGNGKITTAADLAWARRRLRGAGG